MTPVPPADPRAYLRTLGAYALHTLALVLSILVAAAVARWSGRPVALPPPPLPHEHAAHPEDAAAPAVSYEGLRYHGEHAPGDPEHVEANGRPWPVKRITYHLDLSGAQSLAPKLSDDSIRGAFRQAWNWWAEGLDIEPAEVADRDAALVRIRFARMDGPAGVLAESYLADGTLRPKQQTYDSSERWTAGPPAVNLLSLPTVACHEIGHVLGLGHDDATAPAVMRPVYTAAVPREQPRDYARAVALGYKARVKPPAPPPAAADVLTVPASLKTADVVGALKAAGYTVEPPK